VHRRLGGDIAGTDDGNGLKRYPVPYGVMVSNKTSGGGWQGGLLLRDCLGIGRLVVSDHFHLHHLSFLGFIFLSVISHPPFFSPHNFLLSLLFIF